MVEKDFSFDKMPLAQDWREALFGCLTNASTMALRDFLQSEIIAGKTIFPDQNEYFGALNLTPLNKTRVVILGQDPYHGVNQAHGLSFSVRPGIKPPPSLINIYKELENDLGLPRPSHGFLECWASQGVLLLNSVLTVEMGQAASHRGKGWEEITDAVIAAVNALPRPIVFLLWGSHAQKKAARVDAQKHLMLHAPHPSPLSAYKGFFGCKHFSRCNRFLEKQGERPINWSVPEL